MRKLTADEVRILRGFKGMRGGSDMFFDMIEKIYQDDADLMEEISRCRDMKDSLDWIETWPAREKTRSMFYSYMDDLLNKIGYRA